jgi:phosphomannomutase
MADALCAVGCDVLDIGVQPTPVCYFAGRFLKKTASVMVTASHNPGEYNGMKITSNNMTIYGDEIQFIRKMAQQADYDCGPGSISSYFEIENEYVAYLKNLIKIYRPIKIAIDAGNGTAGPIAARLFRDWDVR